MSFMSCSCTLLLLLEHAGMRKEKKQHSTCTYREMSGMTFTKSDLNLKAVSWGSFGTPDNLNG